MKKKMLMIYLFIITIILIGCSNDFETISKNDIQSITIIEPSGKEPCNSSQIESFVNAFNSAKLYRNDVGTTHPCAIDVLLTDGTHLYVYGGSESFATMVRNSQEQQNIQGFKLDNWFSNIMSVEK